MLKLIKYATIYYTRPVGIAIAAVVLCLPLFAKLVFSLSAAPIDDIVTLTGIALFIFLLNGIIMLYFPLRGPIAGDNPSLFLIPLPFLKIILAQLVASLPVWIVVVASFSTLSLLFQHENYLMGLGHFTVLSFPQFLFLTVTYIFTQLASLFVLMPKGAVSEKFAQLVLSIPFVKNFFEEEHNMTGMASFAHIIAFILVTLLVLAVKEYTAIPVSVLLLLMIVLSAALLYGNARLMEKHINS